MDPTQSINTMHTENQVQVRVRFAPSPTGELHIGGLRTALFNLLFARRHCGRAILRIDDTDRERSREEHLMSILESFSWLGLTFDEGPVQGGPYGPYRQSERLALYRDVLDKLVFEGKAYPCYCSAETLEASRKEQLKAGKTPRYAGTCRHLTPEEHAEKDKAGIRPVYRLKVDREEPLVVHDLIRGKVVFQPDQLDDFVIMKSDGTPTYHLASVIDDALMKITHILRAEEHLSNTPRHVLLFEALGTTPPQFAHVPMILAKDRSKLSKRHGATSVEAFRDLGYLPEALVNYSLLLGYAPPDDREHFHWEELAKTFELDRVAKHPAVYDTDKLRWMNAYYMRTLPLERIFEEARPFLIKAGYVDRTFTSDDERSLTLRRIDAVRERVSTLLELVDGLAYFYRPIQSYDEKGVRKHFSKPDVAAHLRRAARDLTALTVWDLDSTERVFRQTIEDLGISGGALIHPTRLAISGRTVGPGLFDIMVLLGKDETIKRMVEAADWIEAHSSGERHISVEDDAPSSS